MKLFMNIKLLTQLKSNVDSFVGMELNAMMGNGLKRIRTVNDKQCIHYMITQKDFNMPAYLLKTCLTSR